jgi:hypothetical protein
LDGCYFSTIRYPDEARVLDEVNVIQVTAANNN